MNIGKHLKEHEALGLEETIRRIARTVRTGGSVGGGASSTGGAPVGGTFIVISADGDLTNERVITAGAGISLTDNGAGNTLVIAATGSAPSMARTFMLMGA